MSKQSVDDRLRIMRDDLIKLVAALNVDGQYHGAQKVQQLIVELEGLAAIGGLQSTDRWAWPPRLDRTGMRILVET